MSVESGPPVGHGSMYEGLLNDAALNAAIFCPADQSLMSLKFYYQLWSLLKCSCMISTIMRVEFVELQEDSAHEDASPYGSSSSEIGSDDYGGDENHDDNDDAGLQLLELMEGDITHGEAMDPLFLK
jgi:hypothetical protein